MSARGGSPCQASRPAKCARWETQAVPPKQQSLPPILVDLTLERHPAGEPNLLTHSVLLPEVLLRLLSLTNLPVASRLALTSLAGCDGVRRFLGRRLAHLSHFARAIWIDELSVVRDAAGAALARPLPSEIRRQLLDALVEVAAARNLRPLRVRALWHSQPTQSGIALKIDFKCPRRHGVLQAMTGVPSAYSMRHGTDDLTLTCSACDRGQIEEDPQLFHCPRFGCCYDLCILCAERLLRHRRTEYS